jgi:ethanolamine utilization protein EutQ
MGAGVERLEKVSFEWTVSYDEILFIKEGSMIIRSFGSEYRCSPDDIMWIPNGTTLVYEVPDVCTYFYALFPVDWAKRQGVKEP